jgi:hypothetical protein
VLVRGCGQRFDVGGDVTNLVLDGAGDGGLGCVRGALALLVGETGRHDGYYWCCWLWFD